MKDIPIVQHPVALAAEPTGQPLYDGTPAKSRRLSRLKERIIESLLFFAAFSSVAITVGIVGTLI